MLRKTIAVGLVVMLPLTACDPPKSGSQGKTKHPITRVTDGTKLTRAHAAMYKANDDGPFAVPANFRWWVTNKKGKLIQSGGIYDILIVSLDMSGSTVHTKPKGYYLYKQF